MKHATEAHYSDAKKHATEAHYSDAVKHATEARYSANNTLSYHQMCL
jgi:hypothetical protein